MVILSGGVNLNAYNKHQFASLRMLGSTLNCYLRLWTTFRQRSRRVTVVIYTYTGVMQGIRKRFADTGDF